MFSPPGLCGGYSGNIHKKSKSFPCGALPESILIIIYESNTITLDVISG